MIISRNTIEKALSNGELKRAIQYFMSLASKFDEDLFTFMLQQKSRLSNLNKEEGLGTISAEEKSRIRNEINFSVITKLTSIQDDWMIDKNIINYNREGDNNVQSKNKTGVINISENVNIESSKLCSGDIEEEELKSKNITGDISIGKGVKIKETKFKTGSIKKRNK